MLQARPPPIANWGRGLRSRLVGAPGAARVANFGERLLPRHMPHDSTGASGAEAPSRKFARHASRLGEDLGHRPLPVPRVLLPARVTLAARAVALIERRLRHFASATRAAASLECLSAGALTWGCMASPSEAQRRAARLSSSGVMARGDASTIPALNRFAIRRLAFQLNQPLQQHFYYLVPHRHIFAKPKRAASLSLTA